MEVYLRYGLLSIAGFIFLSIALEYWFRRRRLKMIEKTEMLTSSMDFSTTSLQEDFSQPISQFESEVEELTEEPIDILPRPNANPFDNDVLILNIFAKPNQAFASYDLLQAISAAGLQFGDMSIFHYHITTDKGQETLFSLASATKPGIFDLNKMGEFSCVGLTLFSDLSNASDPALVWEKILEIAESLAEDLDGVLHSDKRIIWDDSIEKQYQQKVDYYCA